MPRVDLDDPFKQLSLTVAPNIFETALFGVFSLLCLLSTCVLARRGLGSRPYALLMSVILIMYSCGAAHWALSTATLIRLIMDPSASTIPPKITLTISLACLGMNTLLSDAIVLWRAHLVSGRNFFFLVVSGCLYIAKFAILVVNLWRRARYGVPGCCMSDTTSSMGTLMPLLINIWATSLFLRKALADQRDITMYIRNSATWASFTHKVMVLLVESGIFYGMIWAVMFAVSFANADNMRTSTAPPSTIYCLLSFGMVQIAGIYPTIVVVIICLWQSTDGASINGIHLASHTPLSTLSPQVIAPPVRKAGIMRGSLIITEATVARRASLRAAISVDVESLGRHDHDPLVILRDHQKFEGSAT